MDRMLLTVCLFSPAQTQDITLIVPDQPIRAAVGENAVLLCHLEPPTDLEQDMVEWSFNDQTVWVYRNKKENTMDQAKQFSKRVTFSGNKKSGNISVTLQSVNKTDEGNYTCHVERGGKSFRANITLLVEEKCEADWTIGVQQNPKEKSEKKEQNNKNITPPGNSTDNVEPTKSAGAAVGAVVGAVFGAVAVVGAVVGAVAVVICRKRKKANGRRSQTGIPNEDDGESQNPLHQPEVVVPGMGDLALQSL
ncbi:myelin-oligodendrocyte glycoprotein-like isoform X11 [Genypterus blacodes]|uniref:myelin-oligodendrocyte glycoprotein-like isoform X11 n=1 Tax=Genypterus blacodes TaxID=154954 RepID=UPI003F758C26